RLSTAVIRYLRYTGVGLNSSSSLWSFRKRRISMADESKANGLAWFLAGLGVGALVGILYAPKSGRETREDLVTGAREGTEYLRVRGRQAADTVGQMVDKGREQVSTFVDKSKDQEI